MKNLLVLNFFPAFVPPSSGGELRYFNIYEKLSQYYNITLLSPTYSHHKEELIEHKKTFREYRVPKEKIHDHLHLEMDREGIGLEVSGLVCALSAKYPNRYHQRFLELYPRADIIIHDFPYMLNYDLFFGFDDKPRIYNSHNHEALLVRQMWSGPHSQKYIDHVFELEKRLVRKADLTFATSPSERKTFAQEFQIDHEKIKIAPNGINPEELKYDRTPGGLGKIKALFIGSAHPPNIEAVDFIIHDLSKRCLKIDFLIAGSCCQRFQEMKNPNVYFLGKINDTQKKELFRTADIAINPMFSGAGTNLKTLELLSSAIPLVSTSMGVRGLEIMDGEHFILAEGHDFAEKLRALSGNKKSLIEVAGKGQEYVNTHYSWAKIAKDIHEELENLEGKKNKKVILLLNDFEVSNPTAGGEVRINKLYTHLSNYYRILLLCLNNDGIIKHSEIATDFNEISFPKTPEHLQEEAKRNSKFWLSITDIVNSEMCLKNELMKKAVGCIGPKVHAVIFSHPYLAPLADAFDNENVIYESLNCEHELKRSLLYGHSDFKSLMNQVTKVEKMVVERSKFIVSVSDDDHEGLAKLVPDGKKIVTIQNGVEVKEDDLRRNYPSVKEGFKNRPVIIFIGSAHKPNIDALNFIVDRLARKLSHCYFIIIGTVCDALRRPVPPNVLLFGKLDEVYKDVLLRVADVAVNPMFSGSGSNLKLAEYFANKIPVVTTSVGARGYSIQNGKEAIICHENEFSDRILEILDHQKLRTTLVENAFSYVKKNIDWKVLAKRFQHILRMSLAPRDKKKLLVVTYRYTDPPLGGAEVYLFNLIRELDQLEHFIIDVVAPDIYEIYNEFHFSAGYTFSSNLYIPLAARDISVLKFTTDELPRDEKYQNAKELFHTWMKEFSENSLRYVDFFDEPILMGGWFFPEKTKNGVEVWSSGESLIFVNGIEEIELTGWSPQKRVLKIFADDQILFEDKVNGQIHIQIPIRNVRVLSLVIDPLFFEKLDPRPLGIRISRMTCRKGEERKEIRLDYQYRDFLKKKFLDPYVNEMIQIAQKREAKIDDLFQLTRGPLSFEMEEWLDENVQDYDIILGHSIPFRTSILAVKYAKKYGKPVVLLPHFHFDDEFYHWNSYYMALQEADLVLGAPKASIPIFYEKIHAKADYVPGGIFAKEFEKVDHSVFNKFYSSSLPFFLVLGRKAGSKNYQWVMNAVEKVNHEKKRCNLLIIGQDEDGIPIPDSKAIYLGEQPREIVLAALEKCFCLVNMSQSESFGIVILEAWMFGKPVVVNEKCPAFLDLVRDNVNGCLANEQSLPDILLRLLEHPEFAQTLGKNAKTSLGHEYFWENIGKAVNRLLLQLL